MWIYQKKLQYPVRIKNPNPALASMIISQVGGPDGELSASMRYLHQRYSMPDGDVVGMLTDIGSEELGHLEMVSAIIHQLTRNIREDKLMDTPFAPYFVDHTTGVYPVSASGVPNDLKYVGVKGDPIADLNEDLAAEGAIPSGRVFEKRNGKITIKCVYRLSPDLNCEGNKQRRCKIASPLFISYGALASKESKDTVDHKQNACDEDHDAECVTEGEHQTDHDGEDGEQNAKQRFLASLERIDEGYNTLDGDQDTQYQKNDVSYRPTKEQNSDTDDDADDTAQHVSFDQIENTRDDEEYACCRHYPAQRLVTEDDKKNADDDVEQRSKERGIFLFCHEKAPFTFFKLYHKYVSFSIMQTKVFCFCRACVRKSNSCNSGWGLI